MCHQQTWILYPTVGVEPRGGVRCDGGVVGGGGQGWDGTLHMSAVLCCGGSEYQIGVGSDCTVHCYAVQPSVAWHSTAWHSTAWHCEVKQATTRHSMA